MRNTYGSVHLTTASTPVQFGVTTANQKVVWANMKARASNAANMYIGHSSSVNSTNGWELEQGDSLPEEYWDGGPASSVPGNRFWVTSGSTATVLDFSIGIEDN